MVFNISWLEELLDKKCFPWGKITERPVQGEIFNKTVETCRCPEL